MQKISRMVTTLLLCGLFLSTSGFSPHTVLKQTGEREILQRAPRAAWSVDIEGIETSFRVRLATVLPGARLGFHSSTPFQVLAGSGSLTSNGRFHSEWSAPEEPGLYPLQLVPSEGESSDRILVNVFVMVPASELRKGKLRGYSIGQYRNGAGNYSQPDGFIEVSQELEETWVSPHFQLKQFICKQTGEFPKYMRLSDALLTKLEWIIERLGARGVHAKTLAVLSGFRTPHYNRSLGNVPNSRHLYGDAADVFVDTNGDGRMDDLNGDGRSNGKDARILTRIVEDLENEMKGVLPVGGMGMYSNTHTHGPFIHVDARGFAARWARSF